MSDHNPRPETVMGKKLDHSLINMDASKLTWRPSGYALIFNDAGELLLLDNIHNGKLEFPGGGLELWETIQAGVKREVWEETGLTVTIAELIHADDAFFLTPTGKHWHTIKFFYRATIIRGDLRNSIIEDEWSLNPHWVDPSTLKEDDLTIGWDALQIALLSNSTTNLE